MATTRIRVLLCDDHELVRKGVRALLESDLTVERYTLPKTRSWTRTGTPDEESEKPPADGVVTDAANGLLVGALSDELDQPDLLHIGPGPSTSRAAYCASSNSHALVTMRRSTTGRVSEDIAIPGLTASRMFEAS
jgi:DNA-binding NarL/FixJ family response regulator